MPGYAEWFGGEMAAVEGYITPRSARAITAVLNYQQEHQITGAVAEIGVYLAKTYIGLALSGAKGERVVGFDIFPGDLAERAFANLKAHLRTDIPCGVSLVRAESTSLSEGRWREELGAAARFVHIDGGHSSTYVRSDIRLASSYLAPKGVVLIDDFLHDWYPDVTEGILSALRSNRSIRPVAVIPRSGRLLDGGTKLLCSTAQSVDEYAALLRATFPEIFTEMVELAGHPTLVFKNTD